MTLKELMRLCWNAGRDDADERFGGRGWQGWWEKYGKDREQEWVNQEFDEDERPFNKEDE